MRLLEPLREAALPRDAELLAFEAGGEDSCERMISGGRCRVANHAL